MSLFLSTQLSMEHTIASRLFSGKKYPHEVLSEIKDFILKLGQTLPKEIFECKGDGIWIAKSAKVAPTAYIGGPCIIDENAEVRHCAFIRGSAIVGKGAVVGNSTELKNVVLFDSVQVPHYNYVGDSIIGYKAHMGAGAIASNLRLDRKNIKLGKIQTNLYKIGVFLGDYAEVGCGSVICPGTIVGKKAVIYPLARVRGIIEEGEIYKSK